MPPRYDLPNAAPEPLRLVQRFVNSVDTDHGREWLPTPEALAAWFEEQGLPPAALTALTESDLRRAYELRTAIRALLAANNGREAPAEALATVNHAARAAGLGLELGARGPGVVASVDGVEAPFGRILSVAFAAMLDGSWARLKACDQCGWAFYDYSSNRSGNWCSMAICGNRRKTRSYRRRRAGAA